MLGRRAVAELLEMALWFAASAVSGYYTDPVIAHRQRSRVAHHDRAAGRRARHRHDGAAEHALLRRADRWILRGVPRVGPLVSGNHRETGKLGLCVGSARRVPAR